MIGFSRICRGKTVLSSTIGRTTSAVQKRGYESLTVISQKTTIFGGGIVKEQIHPDRPQRLPHFLKHPRTCSVVGMPFSWGQPRGGTDQGPELMRNRGLGDYVTKLEWRLENRGDLQFEEPKFDDPVAKGYNLKNAYAVGQACEKLANETYELASSGRFPLVIGGDHSIALGSIAGILRARPDLAIVWVDAHADINTPETSPSGNLHGMPISFLMGLTDVIPPGFEWLQDYPKLDPENLAFIGLRDVDPGEREKISELGIKAYSMYHVDRYGIGQVMEHCIHSFLKDGKERPIHLSYDIDAVDPDHAPATGTMVRGGFTLREAHYIAERLAETGMLGSMDIVEVNPTLSHSDGANATVELGIHLVASALGNKIL
mmetsp:Transcript_8991/g.14306  ORF Transcript_8991/g.14306 Transcript_8991/m.14306 type:complete len:374 (-) Transcript_8991:299-1420(-)